MAKTRKNAKKGTKGESPGSSTGIPSRTIGLVIAVVLVIVAAVLAAPALGSFFTTTQKTGNSNVIVYFFYGEECPHCHDIRPVVESLQEKYPEVEFRYLEVWHNQTNLEGMAILSKDLGDATMSVPRVIVGGKLLVGSPDIANSLEQAIQDQKKTS